MYEDYSLSVSAMCRMMELFNKQIDEINDLMVEDALIHFKNNYVQDLSDDARYLNEKEFQMFKEQYKGDYVHVEIIEDNGKFLWYELSNKDAYKYYPYYYYSANPSGEIPEDAPIAYQGKAIRCINNQKEWGSVKEASKEMNISQSVINKQLGGGTKDVNGLRFEYVHKKHKTVIMCEETGMTYKTIKEAADKINGDVNGISRCVNGKLPTYKGFHWRKVEV